MIFAIGTGGRSEAIQAVGKGTRHSGFLTPNMDQNYTTWSSWSSHREAAANLSDALDNCNIIPSAVSAGLEAEWQQHGRTGPHDPTPIHFQRSDVLGSGTEYSQSGYHAGIYFEEIPEALPLDYNNFSMSNSRHPNFAGAQPEDVLPVSDQQVSLAYNDVSELSRSNHNFTGAVELEEMYSPDLDHQVSLAPGKRRGRRRANEASEGWTPSKNLISERLRREKLQKNLFDLRRLVPKITKLDRVSILTDAIDHLHDCKQKIEKLENSSGSDFDLSEDEAGDNRNISSTKHGSNCSACFGHEMVRYSDYQMNSSGWDWNQNQLDVTSCQNGEYRLNFTCKQQAGVLVQLSQAIEAFVIEVLYTSIVVITPTKVTCTFVVKMSSWNDMTLENIKADVKQKLGLCGLQFP